MLARRIIDGGRGNWGEVSMTPHPDLSLDQAEQMVHFILSLADYEGADDEEKKEPVAEKIDESLLKAIPGDQREVAGLHPSRSEERRVGKEEGGEWVAGVCNE